MRANPTVIGAFVVGAIVLAVCGVLLFGSGEYFAEMEYYVMFFDDSIDGLIVGSPVKLEGVRIGKVSDVHVEWDVEAGDFRAPVTVEIPAVQGTAFGGGEVVLTGTTEERAQKLIDKGLRASLATQSFITGQKAIVLDFRPDSPVKLTGGKLPHMELPTVRSGLSEVMNELSTIPFKETVVQLRSTLESLDDRVKSDDVTRAINSVSETLDQFKTFGGKLNERIDPLVTNIEATSTEARGTLAQATETLRGVEEKAERLTKDLDETLAGVRKFIADADVEVKPTAEKLRATMEDLQKTLRGIDVAAKQAGLLLRDDSPTVMKVKQALDALADTARSFEALADTLKKQPESLLRGKRGD